MKTLLFFVLILYAFNVCSQHYLLDKYGSTYFHEQNEYEWNELVDVYMEFEEAFNIYNSGINNLNSAKDFSTVGAITMGIGIGAVVLSSGANRIIFGGIILASGTLIELSALIYLVKGKDKMIKARNVFNFEMIKRYGYYTDVSLTFGGTRNGIGLIVQF